MADDTRGPGPDDGLPPINAEHSQHGWDLRFEWGADGLAAVGPGAATVVVVDVLRFTSAVSVAVGRGAVVLPYPWRMDDAAHAYAADHDAELAGWREDGGWSLSPTDLTRIPAGSRLVLPSPNGSALAFAARDVVPDATVLAGCLRNAAGVAAVAVARGGPVAVVAAGERWRGSRGALRPAVEDLLGAGAVLRALREETGTRPGHEAVTAEGAGIAARTGDGASSSTVVAVDHWSGLAVGAGVGAVRREPTVSPEGRVAIAAFEAARRDLGAWLADTASGRELVALGFGDDVEAAATLDAEDVAPVLHGAAFAGVAPGGSGPLR